ncbi:MAG: cytochrome c3 family protein [Desulfobacteraceae bacterium]|jgi:hypothetical protein|nr:cytochrome c3 family protein [Desulfobacteraceae bacterium]
MLKPLLGCLGLIVVLSVAAVGMVSGEELCIPTGTFTIHPPESVEPQRAPVDFPHSLHFSYNCQECHHNWEGDAGLTGCMTSGCHDLEEAPESPDSPDAVYYYKNAFHTACIGCHKSILQNNQKLAASGRVLSDKLPATGPTSCVACHPKD